MHQSQLLRENKSKNINSEAIPRFQNVHHTSDVIQRLQSGLLNQNIKYIAYDLRMEVRKSIFVMQIHDKYKMFAKFEMHSDLFPILKLQKVLWV